MWPGILSGSVGAVIMVKLTEAPPGSPGPSRSLSEEATSILLVQTALLRDLGTRRQVFP